jgi:hypothetical protein
MLFQAWTGGYYAVCRILVQYYIVMQSKPATCKQANYLDY